MHHHPWDVTSKLHHHRSVFSSLILVRIWWSIIWVFNNKTCLQTTECKTSSTSKPHLVKHPDNNKALLITGCELPVVLVPTYCKYHAMVTFQRLIHRQVWWSCCTGSFNCSSCLQFQHLYNVVPWMDQLGDNPDILLSCNRKKNSCFLFLNPTPHTPHKGLQQFHEHVSFSGFSNVEEVERRWHALRRPSSPPQASHPCSEFQVRLHNLMPLGMLIFLLRYRNILGLLSSHSSDSKKYSKAPIVGHRGEVKIQPFR